MRNIIFTILKLIGKLCFLQMIVVMAVTNLYHLSLITDLGNILTKLGYTYMIGIIYIVWFILETEWRTHKTIKKSEEGDN